MSKKHHNEEKDEAAAAQAAAAAEEAEAPKEEAPSPPPPEAPAKAMTVEQERDDLLARLQRVSADFLNYQKRAHRDVETARQFANEDLVKALLPVLDDMERALAAAKENHPPEDPLLVGMQLAHDKALQTLGRYGLSVIDDAGGKFDPDRHAAILQQVSQDSPPLTVLQVAQKGYCLKGRTIRPASVIVSQAPREKQDAEGDEVFEP